MIGKLIDIFLGDIPTEHRRAFVRILFRAMFLFHVAWACGWFATFGIPGFAQAGEVAKVKEELKKEIDDVKDKVASVEAAITRSQKVQTRTAYESELRRINQEIFTIEAKIKEATDAGQRPDMLYRERLGDLTIERNRVESRLTAFLRANPDIAGATF